MRTSYLIRFKQMGLTPSKFTILSRKIISKKILNLAYEIYIKCISSNYIKNLAEFRV